MAIKTRDIYKYSTFLLLIVVIVLIAALAYNSGRNSISYTTIPQSSSQTSSQTTQPSFPAQVQCSNQYTAVSVGNSLTCGSFTAKVAQVNATNVTLQIYYHNVYVNQSIFGGNMQKSFNFGSGGTFGIYMAGPIPSNQSAYFIIDTGYVVCTTITIPTTTIS